VDCDLGLPGAWEIGRKDPLPYSPISWTDSGNLRAVREVPGGTIDPGKMISGLARAADRAGALIFENTRVEELLPGERLGLQVSGKKLFTRHILFATNAQSLEMSALSGRTQPMFTLALATAPLPVAQIEALGLASGKPFYTIDFPYLWGRLLPGNAVLFGGGWSRPNHWSEMAAIDIATGELARMLAGNEKRIRELHPALRSAEFTHRWGGPILIGDEWRPVFARHPADSRVLVCGAYSGHGVALSVYLGRWAAEAMLGRRELPSWDGASGA
jgi:glycine/D-amino acid oxidase-like deaminating enzyme